MMKTLSSLLLATAFVSVVKAANPTLHSRDIVDCTEEQDFEEHYCQDLFVTQLELDRFTIATNKVKLTNFVKTLKTYVNESNFDFVAFGAQSEEMKTELTEIIRAVRNTSLYDTISRQALSTRRMFHVMADASVYLKNYETDSVREHAIVYELVRLNVRILALHDLLGFLDVKVKNYITLIPSLYRTLLALADEFERLKGVPAFETWMFRAQASLAEESLQTLWRQVPDREFRCLSLGLDDSCVKVKASGFQKGMW